MSQLWVRFRNWYVYTVAGVLIDGLIAYTVLAAFLALLVWLSGCY